MEQNAPPGSVVSARRGATAKPKLDHFFRVGTNSDQARYFAATALVRLCSGGSREADAMTTSEDVLEADRIIDRATKLLKERRAQARIARVPFVVVIMMVRPCTLSGENSRGELPRSKSAPPVK